MFQSSMDWQVISSIAEIIGAIAVVISLAYVAIQVRSTTEQNRAMMEQAIADRLNDNMMIASSTDIGSIVHRGMADFTELDEAEKSKFTFYYSSWFRSMEQAHRQYLRGFLDVEVWSGYEAYLSMTLESAAVRSYWQAREKVYNKNFRGLVQKLLATDSLIPVNIVEATSKTDA